MSADSHATLPLRLANDAGPSHSVSNTNHGEGKQYNATQAGGSGNNQYNGIHQTFHNHTVPKPQVKQPWRLPRKAASQYTGYTDVAQRLKSSVLEQQSDQRQTVFVLSGMGGVGKSEAVLQFVDRNTAALQRRFWAVLWVDCTSEASVRAEFKIIGGLCGWPAVDGDPFCGAKDQLASSDNATLLILDNCDELKTNFSLYIPNSPRVSVVMTTRLSDAAKYASWDRRDSSRRLFLRMEGLDEGSAVRLILEASNVQDHDQETRSQAREIAHALDFHPLAIVVASSLIESAVYSLGEYATALEKRFAQKELQDTDSEQATYGKVSTTFEVSAEALQRLASKDPSAKDALALLDIFAFMDRQGVAEEIFIRAWKFEDRVLQRYVEDDGEVSHLSLWHVAQCRLYLPFRPLSERRQWFRKCRVHLVRLSLMSLDPAQQSISLHPLVHTWARERSSNPREVWKATASMLALPVSTEGSNSWQVFSTQLARHCEASFALWQQVGKMTLNTLDICRVWYVFAWQMYRARSARSMDICKHFLDEVERLSSEKPDRLLVAYAQDLLGIVYKEGGQTVKAIAALEHALEARKHLPKHDARRLNSRQELSLAYLGNGQISQAIEMLEYVVKVLKKKLPEDDTQLLNSQHQLACAYQANRQISQAIEILEHVVNMRKEKLAGDHPTWLASQHEIARAYKANGQLSQAVEILEHVVEVKEKLAEDHPSRLASQHVLATVFWTQGRKADAENLMGHVVAVQKRSLQENHPDRVNSERGLAKMVRNRERCGTVLQPNRPSKEHSSTNEDFSTANDT